MNDFLSALLSNEKQLESMERIFAIERSLSLEQFMRSARTNENAAFLDAPMNLVQFQKITYQPSVGDLAEMFSRGMGAIAQTDEAAFDIYLPVLLGEKHSVDSEQDILPTACITEQRSGEKAGVSGTTPAEPEVLHLMPGVAAVPATAQANLPVQKPTHKGDAGDRSTEQRGAGKRKHGEGSSEEFAATKTPKVKALR